MVKILVVFLVVVIVLGMLELGSSKKIPQIDRTNTVLTQTKYRILVFYKNHKRCPYSLLELPQRDGYNDSFLDGFEREITYNVDKHNFVTLTGGKVGSHVNNQSEIKIKFRCK